MNTAQINHNKQCREEAEEMMAFIGERPVRFWQELLRMVNARLSMAAPVTAAPKPAAPLAARQAGGVAIPINKTTTEKDVEAALELCDEIDSLADDVPEPGFDFAESVREKSRSIAATIEATGRVTPNQLKALENMRDGLAAWRHDD